MNPLLAHQEALDAVAAAMNGVSFPVTKSMVGDDGEWYIEGEASGPDLDLQGEDQDLEIIKKSIPYFLKHGKVNWNHGPDGKGINPRDPDHLPFLIGDPVAAEIRPNGRLWMKVRLFKTNAIAKSAWGISQAKGKLAFSIEGTQIATVPYWNSAAGKMVRRAFTVMTDVALTTRPIWSQSWATAVKAIHTAMEDHEMPELEHPTFENMMEAVAALPSMLKSFRTAMYALEGEEIPDGQSTVILKALSGAHDEMKETLAAFDFDGMVERGFGPLLESYGLAVADEPAPAAKAAGEGTDEPGLKLTPPGSGDPDGGTMDETKFAELLGTAVTTAVKAALGDIPDRLKALEGGPAPAGAVSTGLPGGGDDAPPAPVARPVAAVEPAQGAISVKSVGVHAENEQIMAAINSGAVEPQLACAVVMSRGGGGMNGGPMLGYHKDLAQGFALEGVEVSLN